MITAAVLHNTLYHIEQVGCASTFGIMAQRADSDYEDDMPMTPIGASGGINDARNMNTLPSVAPHVSEVNDPFRVAAVYLHEGRMNLKLSEHPRTSDQMDTWFLLRRSWFPYFDLFMALLYMCLAIVEAPAVQGASMPVSVIVAIQTTCLATNLLQIFLKFRIAGSFQTGRIPKGCNWQLAVVFILTIDLIIYMIHSVDPKWHVLRVFRPAYLLSCQKASEIRRVLRQILHVCYEVIEMMIFLFFYVGVFSVAATFLFASNEEDSFFHNLGDSYTQLFVLITTCNYPSVMLPAFTVNQGSFFFFFVFIVIGIYFILNLILAIVYKFYTEAERAKFRQRFLHQRAAIRRAYKVLTKHGYDNGISMAQFRLCMKQYRSRFTEKQIVLFYHSLNRSGSGALSLEEFYDFFEFLQLRWHRKGYSEGVPTMLDDDTRKRSDSVSSAMSTVWNLGLLSHDVISKDSFLSKLVRSHWIDAISDMVVFLQAVFLTYKASIYTSVHQESEHDMNKIIFGFLVYFTVEILIKGGLLSFRTYWFYSWHRFDVFFTVAGWITLAVDYFTSFHSAASVVILRAFRLSSLLTMSSRKTFTHIMTTAITITPRMVRFAGTLFCTYYVFAIIGMTFLADTASTCASDLHTDCGLPYAYIPGQNYGHYQEMNFNDVWHSYITLFTLMVVNDWNNTMGGHAATATNWSRAFFMLFYVFTVLVVVNVILAYVLEMFQIVVVGQQAKERKQAERLQADANLVINSDAENMTASVDEYDELPEVSTTTTVEVQLSLEDLRDIGDPTEKDLRRMSAADRPGDAFVTYEGMHRMSQYTLYLILFHDSVDKWIETEKQLVSSDVDDSDIYA